MWFSMQNGKPPDLFEQFLRNLNSNANPPITASTSSNNQQPRLDFPGNSSRPLPLRPQQRLPQPFAPQQQRYSNPVPRASSPWHPTAPVTVSGNNTANHATTSSNNKFLSTTQRPMRSSTPTISMQRPSPATLTTAPLSRSTTPMKPQIPLNCIKVEDDLAAKLSYIGLAELERELNDLEGLENDEDDSDLSAEDISHKIRVRREIYELEIRQAEV